MTRSPALLLLLLVACGQDPVELCEDFDWKFMQAAPRDQQISYLRGDEEVQLR